MFDFENFLKQISQMRVSDIHLRVGEVPTVRKDGEIIKTNIPQISKSDMEIIVEEVFPKDKINDIDKIYNFDFLYEVPGVSRFRVNYAKSKNEPMLVMRIVPYTLPTFEEMHLPKVLQTICEANNGIIFVTGPTGAGKSTTLAAMLDYVNANFAKHIITLEDPIEYLHKNKKSIFSQRQIGTDTENFNIALKYALRQDPDIILIGEIRDKETAKLALNAAETGHLVFTTMHTKDSIQTINRIVNMFEPHERGPIRTELSQVLKATISQKLLHRENHSGRIPAFEILIATPAIIDYIEKDRLDEVYSLLKEGKYSDMITLNMYLFGLVKNKMISEEIALNATENKTELIHMLKGAYHGTSA